MRTSLCLERDMRLADELAVIAIRQKLITMECETDVGLRFKHLPTLRSAVRGGEAVLAGEIPDTIEKKADYVNYHTLKEQIRPNISVDVIKKIAAEKGDHMYICNLAPLPTRFNGSCPTTPPPPLRSDTVTGIPVQKTVPATFLRKENP